MPYIPPGIDAYIEPFMGSAALFFSGEQWANMEVLNDTNSDVVNFFRTLRQEPEELKRLISFTPYSREEFYDCLKIIRSKNEDNLTRAWAFYVTVSQSIMNAAISWAGTAISTSDEAQRRINREEILLQAAERLKKAIIDNQDYLYILNKYENKNSFFYLDPPYLSLKDDDMTRRAYRGAAFREEKHIELLEKITQMKGFILISGYQNALYDQKLKGWHKMTIKEKQVKSPSADHIINEIIWINPAAFENKVNRDKKIKQLRLEI
jgi:DNA adenine methylase